MAQEENILGCSSYSGGAGGSQGGGGGGGRGGGGGCSSGVSCSRSKKIKQKKVPQRGLGVAQLEKIRLEEQQKKESLQAANILAKNAVGSSADSNPYLAVHKYRQGVSPFHNSVPLPPPLPSDLNLPYRHSQSLPNLEMMQEQSLQVSKQSNAGVGELDSMAISNQPRLWAGEFNLAREKLRLDQHNFAFDPQVNLSYEDTPSVLSFSIVSQRSHQFHQPSSSSSMAHSSSGILPSPAVSSQMEPPSNQSFRSNNYATLWADEDKMVGMKRSYPFSQDSPSAPSSHRSFHPTCHVSSEELGLCSNGYTDRIEPRNKCIRLGHEKKPNEVTIDDGKLNGDFLTLAPPSVASPPLNAKHKHPFGYSGCQEHEYECKPSQEYINSHIHQPGSSGSEEKTFSFFPTNLQIDKTTTNERTGNGDKGETIDLNLKL